jgi:hypothetical protein
MGKVATSKQFRNLVGNLNMCSDELIEKIDHEKMKQAVNQCFGGCETKAEFVKWINNDCRLTALSNDQFIVGQIFSGNNYEIDEWIFMDKNTRSILVEPNEGKIITISKFMGGHNEYVLPEAMNDSTIQDRTGSPGYMNEEHFLSCMYVSIFQPYAAKRKLGFSLRKSLDNWYTFHVFGNEIVSYRVRWLKNHFLIQANDFDLHHGQRWSSGGIFVYCPRQKHGQ